MKRDKVVYLHINSDTKEVFYVGLGTAKRAYEKAGRNSEWKKYVSKNKWEVEIVDRGLTLYEAVEKERAYISEFGRRDNNTGVLLNRTDGGEGGFDTNSEREFFVYNKEGVKVGDKFTKKTFCEFIYKLNTHNDGNNVIDNESKLLYKYQGLSNALNGDKGYGFFEGHYVSYNDIKIMDKKGEHSHLNDTLAKIYPKILKDYSKKEGFDEDVLNDAVIYLYERVEAGKSLNNIEIELKCKYRFLIIDKYRKTKKDNFIIEDFDIEDENGRKVSYIENFAVESATQDGVEDACLHQVNELKLAEIVKNLLYMSFKEKDVDLYIDYIENFKNIRVAGQRSGLKGAADKHNVSVSTVKNKVKKIEAFLKDKKENVLDEFYTVFYPDIDNLTLKHIIDEGK